MSDGALELAEKEDTQDCFPNILSIEAAAKYLTISKYFLYTLVKGGFVPYAKIGKRIVFRKNDLYDWIGQNVVQPTHSFDSEEEYDLSEQC